MKTHLRYTREPYYERNGIVIYHGDSREILPELGMFDLLLTDPPYGIGEAAGKNKSRGHATTPTDYGDFDWDNSTIDFMDLVRSSAKHQIIFGGNFYDLPPTSCFLVWDKDNTGDFADCELAWTNLKKAVRMKKHRWNGMLQERAGKWKEPRFHPTQKPLEVMRWCITQAPEGVASIIDPFMGSGTSLVAAKDLGIAAVGIEREEKYCEIAANRLAQEVFEFAE